MNERDIFLSALDVEDLSAMDEYLQDACGGDAELLARVQDLLKSHENASQFLNTPAVEQIADGSPGKDSGPDQTTDDTTNDAPNLAATIPLEDPEQTNDRGEEMDEEISLGFLEPSTHPDSLGRLGHYEILELLAQVRQLLT